MLRRLPVAAALEVLRHFVSSQRNLGAPEVLVIVGKGRHSPGGEPVLRPQVDAWLRQHPDSVLAVERAPARLGGEGALLVRLRPIAGRKAPG